MDGAFSVGDKTQLLYIAEGTRQTEYAGGDSRINANYARVGGGVWWSNVGLRLDHEIKGSNNGVYGFQTPLTDRYAFNGTALQFTTTPRQGLRDTWITVRGEIAKFDLYAEYHIFRSDFGGFNFGQEFDVSVAYPIRKNLIAKLQHAHYRPGSTVLGKLDVQKTWLALTYNY